MRGRKIARPGKAAAAYLLTGLLCLGALLPGAGAETEQEAWLQENVTDNSAVQETGETAGERAEEASPECAQETQSMEEAAWTDLVPAQQETEVSADTEQGFDEILAGPVELNDSWDALITDPEGCVEQTEAEKSAETGAPLESDPGQYEGSMTFQELAALPREEAGAATWLSEREVPATGKKGMLKMAGRGAGELWTCVDYYVGEEDLHHVSEREDFSLKYQMEFHASTDLGIGNVTIRVPEALLTDRAGERITPSQIGVPEGSPEAPVSSLNSPFNWYLDEAENTLVFFNYRAIPAGCNCAFQVLYHPVRIADLKDGSDWSILPKISVTLQDGTTQTKDMDVLTGNIDSFATLSGSSADAYSDGSIGCLPALYTPDQVKRILGGTLPAQFSGEDGAWLFVVWQIDAQGEFNQPWSLKTDAVLLAQGTAGDDALCVVGSITRVTGSVEGADQEGIVKRYLAAQGSNTITELTSQDLAPYVSQGTFRLKTTAVTAVRRQALRENGSVLRLETSSVLEPADGLDEVSRSEAAASWTFVDYRWKYKGDDVGIFATTGQRGADGSVSYTGKNSFLSGWVNEYRLLRESGLDAGSVPMRIHSECRGYSHTHELQGPAAGSYLPGTCYEVTTADDVVYLAALSAGSDAGMQMLGPQDYYYSGISVTVKDRGIDIFEDRICAPMSEAACAGADRSAKIWVMYEDSSDWELAAQCPWNSSGKITYAFSRDQLSRKIWRVKVVHRAVDYDSSCTIDTTLCIRHDSPVCNALLSGSEEDDLTVLKTEHLGSVLARSISGSSQTWFHDSGSSHYENAEPGLSGLTMSLYGIYSMRDSSFAELGSVKKHAKAVKTVSRENDPENGCVRMTCRIGTLEGYRIYSREAAENIVRNDSNLPAPDRSEYVIYDLLPEGVQFDPSAPLRAGLVMGESDQDLVTPSLWNRKDVRVRIDPAEGVCRNWKHTGRDLVVLQVSILLEKEQIPRLCGGMWMNGVGVEFGTSCAYKDLKRMKTMPNIAAVMPERGCSDPAGQILGAEDETSCDDGIVVPYTEEEKKELGAFGADINADGITSLRTVLYAYAWSAADTALSLTDGIDLHVKADREAYSDWERSAHTAPGDSYTYRIDVTNSSSSPISEIVLTAHLEIAAEERAIAESTRVFDEQTWTGFLELVDTESVQRMGIAPVIWLNEDRHAILPGEGNPPEDVLTSQNGWMRLEDWTKEMDCAHSVAVELRRKTDGSNFTLEMGDNVHILLHMRAPRLEDWSGPERAEHAYQCASFYSISEDEPDGDLVECNAVEVTLEERNALIVEKELAGQVRQQDLGRAFLFRLLRHGKPLPLAEYRLEEKQEDADGQVTWRGDETLHTTARDGTFSLKSGQRAVFEEEAGGAGLSAEEILSACYEKEVTEERTGAGSVLRFANSYHPPLYLTKKVYGAPEGVDCSADVFRVKVTADGKSMKGMPYWTVNRTDGLVEDEILQKHTVDENSCVLLHAGEVIALHPGPADCIFEVEEDADCFGEGTDYVGVTWEKNGILSPEGSSVTLENAWRWKEMILRKEILHQGAHDCGECFSFRLWRMKEGADAASFDPDNPQQMAEPAAGIEGCMGQESFQTDENGCFCLPCAGKEVRLKHLEALASYVIQETAIPAFYEPLNEGLASCTMPLFAGEKTIVVKNAWKKRSLEVSKTVLSGAFVNRTTVATPGYPGAIPSGLSSAELFSASLPGMNGFIVTFPEQISLVGEERILVRAGEEIIDSYTGTIAAGTSRSYPGCLQVSFSLWGITGKNQQGFFFWFLPDTGTTEETGGDASGKTFSFLLETEDETGNLSPAPDTPYVSQDGEEGRTDGSGYFYLKAGMRALFTDLGEEGEKWRVTETPDPSCRQVYPSGAQAHAGVLGQQGMDTTHALFINGQDCQGMFRKQFCASENDAAAAQFLEEERAKGSASCLKSEFLIEIQNGGGWTRAEGSVRIADALTGELLSASLYQGTIFLSEHQSVILSGLEEGQRVRITERKPGCFTRDPLILQAVCIAPGEEGMQTIQAGGDIADLVFVNELRSVNTTPQSLICKSFRSGAKGWEKVPDGAVLAFCLERWENGAWIPAENVRWIQCLDQAPLGEKISRTDADGIIRVRKAAASDASSLAGQPVAPIAVADGNVRTQLYYLEHEAQPGDLRIREVPDLSDPSFGMLFDCEGNVFINENDLQTLVVEKQTDIETSQMFSMKILQRIGRQTLPGSYLPYRIRDAKTQEWIQNAKTDAEGNFTIKGGWQAVFSLGTGTKWEILEKSSGNWNLASCTMDSVLSNPEQTSRGMQFEVNAIRTGVTLTRAMLEEGLTDAVTGQTLDFSLPDVRIPHYVRQGEEVLEITNLDAELFSRSSLQSVFLADGIRSIGAKAFYYCSQLKTVRLPETLETIGDNCFSFSAVSSLEFSSAVKRVGNGITMACYSLLHVIIHQNEEESPFSGYRWYANPNITVEFTG